MICSLVALYTAKLKNGSEITIHSPAQFPQKIDTAECLEPMVMATLTLPDRYLGKTIQLCMVGDCSIREINCTNIYRYCVVSIVDKAFNLTIRQSHVIHQ